MLRTSLNIEKLKDSDVFDTSVMLAETMCTNPNHISIFGSPEPNAIEKQRRMFEMVLRHVQNTSFIVRINGEIAGSMTYTSWDSCQIPALKIVKSLPKYLKIFGRTLVPVLKWRKNWSDHDPLCPHVHFGPLAVRPSYQGKGIGKMLLSTFCRYLDETHQAGYLETDKVENVLLYERFGFEVMASSTLFGKMNWFMIRWEDRNSTNALGA